MATYNGMAEGGAWLDEQVDSVLAQTGVEVRLVVSDDASSDGTRAHLEARAAVDPRISVLPQREGKPGVTGNFLHLFTTHVPDGSFVAFTDQDDVWHRDKLSGQLALMRAEGACVVSSNVTAFESLPGGAVGERRLIRKSQPQRAWDFLFEAAGPGSTYLFSPDAHAALVEAVSRLDYSEIGVHDWYLYALARARPAVGDRRGTDAGVPPARRQRAGSELWRGRTRCSHGQAAQRLLSQAVHPDGAGRPRGGHF